MHISPPHSPLRSVARRSAISNRRSGLLKHLKAWWWLRTGTGPGLPHSTRPGGPGIYAHKPHHAALSADGLGAGRRCTVPTVLTDKPVEPMLILSS